MIVGGTRPAHCTWVVKDGGSGSSFVQISNAANGETVLWNNALGAGYWLRLKSEGQTVELSTDSGSNWNPATLDNMTGVIPRLSGGSSNAVTVTGVDGTVAWNYYAVG